jgi:hypothetical protein
MSEGKKEQAPAAKKKSSKLVVKELAAKTDDVKGGAGTGYGSGHATTGGRGR